MFSQDILVELLALASISRRFQFQRWWGSLLDSRHYGDAPVEKWAALGGESVTREGNGATLDYNSAIGNEFLAYMRQGETLQAILRFGRDEEGAVVFAHTSALAECLPVVAEGRS
jgi:hypothetical protein